MTEVINTVMGSRRLRRFAAMYAMLYIVISLVLNLISSTGIFSSFPMNYLFSLLSLAVQAPFLFGCARGIVTRDYRIGYGLAAFGETDKYPFYAAYIIVNLLYSGIYDAAGAMSGLEGSMGKMGLILTAVAFVIGILIDFLAVGIYLDAIYFEGDRPRFSAVGTLGRFASALSKKPGRVIAIAIFNIVVEALSLWVAILLADLLPAHSAVSLALTCLASVQFGFIMISWPIYYLYNKATYGISDRGEMTN